MYGSYALIREYQAGRNNGRFRILERIFILSYIFVTLGTVERPFPAKTYHYRRTSDLERFKKNAILIPLPA